MNVMFEKTTADLMKALANMYQIKKAAFSKARFMRKLLDLKMAKGTSVLDHITEFNMIMQQLRSVNVRFDDEFEAIVLLCSSPQSWSGTLTRVDCVFGEEKLELKKIRDLLLEEVIFRRERMRYLTHP